MIEKARFGDAIHRKLRAIAALLLDPASTEHERTNAKALKIRLEKRLRQESTPGDLDGYHVSVGPGD